MRHMAIIQLDCVATTTSAWAAVMNNGVDFDPPRSQTLLYLCLKHPFKCGSNFGAKQ